MPTRSAAAEAASMSLLDKNEHILRSIDQAREDKLKLEQEMAKFQDKLDAQQQQRESMRAEIATAQQQAATLEVQVQDVLQQSQSDEYAEALRAKQQAQQQYDGLQQYVAEHRRKFLEDSRAFRANVQRLHVQASSLGLEYTSQRAFSMVQGQDTTELYNALEQKSSGTPSMDNDTDLDQWTAPDDDDEFQQALSLYHTRKREYEAACANLESDQQAAATRREQANSRRDRRDQLQHQLERLRNDNGNLQTQIDELKEATEETKVMGESFAQNLKRRQQTSTRTVLSSTVTPSPMPRSNHRPMVALRSNPYRRHTSHTTNNATRSPTTTTTTTPGRVQQMRPQQRTAVQAAVLGPSLLERQHPHRAGRIRRDRQFGSSLEVSGGIMMDDDDDNLIRQDSVMEYPPEPKDPPVMSAVDQTMEEVDDDDDDDDDLLSYVAFSK